MRKKLLKYFLLIITLINVHIANAQSGQPHLIAKNQKAFINTLISPKKSKPLAIKIDANQSLALNLTVKTEIDQTLTLIGNVNGEQLSTFSFSEVNGKLEGSIVLPNSKKAYSLYSEDDGKVYIKQTDINSILCVDLEKTPDQKRTIKKSTSIAMAAPELESLPGATGIIYLDFDGEVVSNTSWLSGATINAQSPNYTNAEIIEIWKIMAEDFRPFNLNVTTRRDLFDAAPRNRRMMCIFTPTKDAAPTSGGVAYVNSFSSTRDNPCWVYNLSIRAAGETGSHEVGHTLGLRHHGKGSTTYYNGHGQWSPIMGWSASRPIGHWSAGEYEGASNPGQDDVAIIANSRNGVGFQDDDHADDINTATSIRVSPAGDVSASQNFGLISTRDDKDVFTFAIETGPVSFSFEPDPDYPNLNIQARILNELGQEVAISDPAGLSASISQNLSEGIYFIEIDGVGEGTVNNGYSDFSSLGNYTISGSYIPGDDKNPPLSEFESSQDCTQIQFTSTSTNRINSYLWNFGDGQTSTQQNPTHTYAAEGDYTVSLTTTNDSGSDTEEKINYITIRTPSQPIISDQNICSGESITLSPTGNSDFNWYSAPSGGSRIASGTTYTTPELTSNQTYYVEGVIGGCTTATRTQVNITVAPSPNQPSAVDQRICSGESVTLSVSGNSEYNWYESSTGGTRIATGSTYETPTLTSSKTYYVEGILGDCSTATRTEVRVEVAQSINQPTASDQNICSGEFTIITVTGNSEYNWYETPTGGTVIATGDSYQTPILKSTKTYYIEGVIGGCFNTTRTEVKAIISENPESPVIFVNQNQSLAINSEFSTYQWYFNNSPIEDANLATYTPLQSGEYQIEVFNDSGCNAISEKFSVDQSMLNAIRDNNVYTYYPNPVKADGLLNIEGFTIEDYDVRIVNIQGQILIKSTPTSQLDLSELSNGLYILLINNKPVGKFIKQ
ncbi:Ig-like domain-containing protein [Aquimarina mytili]|uniref:PKD domain-containing protein n=1 Tax=Aquimarina mytili TaxID=874423 RepID=A0A937A2W2_9FLAO|nr:PKD domain-containing protein [Aquimarina mytili]MBL0685876.1 PKD domain-containing protein [Aquimarina mytili]